MHKIQRTAGKSFETLEVGGKRYTIRPLTIGVYAEMEAYVLSKRVDLIAIAGASIHKVPQPSQPLILDSVMRVVLSSRNVTLDEMKNFENSIEGIAWRLWQQLKSDHPEVDSIEKARSILEEAGPKRAEEITLKMFLASGEADMGKSSGPTPAMEQGQDGQPSTSSCLSTTD